ncbi:MAG: hypothetical protein JWM28_257 [Chitinophagaceae bacterium]|nr:hypothetical protein [Chitinophagaceae bacterium]
MAGLAGGMNDVWKLPVTARLNVNLTPLRAAINLEPPLTLMKNKKTGTRLRPTIMLDIMSSE